MSDHDKELENKELTENVVETADKPCPQRRRLLAMLGVGVAVAYVAPTLFSAGEAEARNRYDKRGRRGHRSSYSRGSYSRGSRYGYRGRERSRLRDYEDDPYLILEDVIFGPPRR